MEWIKYEGVSFNKGWVASKTLKEFCEHEKHHGLNEKQMKEVYDLCKKPVKPAVKEKGSDTSE